MASQGAERNGASSERVRKEASDLFAEFVARRADGEQVAFEEWVRGHPVHAGELRRMHEHWSTFERELGRLHEPVGAEPDASDPVAGELVGDFRLLEVVGAGGMGRVWRAERRSNGEEVALKLVLPSRQTARGLSFFEREGRAASRVRHPGVVAVLDTGVDDGVHWIAAELVPGGRTLAGFLETAKRRERFPPGYFTHVARLFARVADAVQAAHEARVIHRDLKPRNILLSPDGTPKVTDFGLARIIDEEGLSKTGDFAGTYFYMSPEQVTARRIGIDHRTDVFSLGAVLYEALTLRCPFEADSGYEVAEKILYEDLPDPHALSHDVPEELAWICAKALEKRRGDRFQSMAEMRDELLGFSERKPIRTRPAGLARRVRRRVMRRPMRSALVAVSAAALLAVGLLLGWAVSSRGVARSAGYELALNNLMTAGSAGDLDEAARQLERAAGIYPERPTPHLFLASYCAEYDRWSQARAHVAQAREKGYEPAAGSAEEHAHRALTILAEEPIDGRDEAEAEIDRALELDPLLKHAWFLKFRVRAAHDDDAGALAALSAYRGFLSETLSPEFRDMLEAFQLEHEGRYDEALALLEQLDVDRGEDSEWPAPRLDRALGRLCLRAGLEAEAAGDLARYRALFARARGHLEAALEVEGTDYDSLLGLAQVHLRRTEEVDDPAAELARAEELAGPVLARHPDDPTANAVTATIAAMRILERDRAPSVEVADEAIARIDAALALSEPDSGSARSLRGVLPQLRISRAQALLEARRFAEAVDAFAVGLADDEEHALGHVLLGETLWWLQEFEQALTEFERALELVDEPSARDWSAYLGTTAHVWALWSAGMLGDAERCEAEIAAVEAALEADAVPPVEELVTYAEFFADGPLDGYRDCDRVRALLEDHYVREALGADPDLAARCREVMTRVDRNCPP